MNFFMLSKCGEGAGLLYRIQQEGNSCSLKILEKDYSSVYDGLLKKAAAPEKGSIVLVDSSGMGKEADELRAQGFSVFGGSEFADHLEQDREFGLDFMTQCGINVPKTERFKSFKKGIQYVQDRDTKLVFKPSGNLPCKLTYCSEDANDLIHYMQFVEKYYGKEIEDFVLQDFVEGSIISTEFWVGPKGLIHPANHTVEVKKFLNDDLGPSTGCQGNLVWLAEDDAIVDALMKTKEHLVHEQFCGCIDLNAIINEDGIFGLEWTPRFGLDAMPTFLQLVSDVGQLVHDSATGTIQEMKGLTDSFASGVRLTIPPYPAEPKSSKGLEEQVPSVGVPLNSIVDFMKNVYAYEIKCDSGELVHSDGTGVIAVISHEGDDPEEAFESCYKDLENIKIPDKQYRTDLAAQIPEMYLEAMEVLEDL